MVCSGRLPETRLNTKGRSYVVWNPNPSKRQVATTAVWHLPIDVTRKRKGFAVGLSRPSSETTLIIMVEAKRGSQTSIDRQSP